MTAILIEQTPAGIESEEIRNAILTVRGVKSFHDLHLWTISSGFAAHVLPREKTVTSAAATSTAF